MAQALPALGLTLLLLACHSFDSGPSITRPVTIHGTIVDSSGVPILGARVRVRPNSVAEESLPLAIDSVLANEVGWYETVLDSLPTDSDSLIITAFTPECTQHQAVRGIAAPPGGTTAPSARVDFVIATAVPKPSPQAAHLCAFDALGTFASFGPWVVKLLLHIDSAQTIPIDGGVLFGGIWDQATAASTLGSSGTFAAVQTADAVVLDLTYSQVYPNCRSPQRFVAPVLPDGRWGFLVPVASTSCPVGIIPLVFGPTAWPPH